jgi:hypothetical protein
MKTAEYNPNSRRHEGMNKKKPKSKYPNQENEIREKGQQVASLLTPYSGVRKNTGIVMFDPNRRHQIPSSILSKKRHDLTPARKGWAKKKKPINNLDLTLTHAIKKKLTSSNSTINNTNTHPSQTHTSSRTRTARRRRPPSYTHSNTPTMSMTMTVPPTAAATANANT